MTEQEARAEAERQSLADAMIQSDALMPDVRAEAMVQGSHQREPFLMFADAVLDWLGDHHSPSVVEAAPSDIDREALVAELRFLPEFVQGTHNGKPLPLANFTRDRIAKALTTAADALSRVSQPVQVEVTTAAELDALNLDAVVVDFAGVPRTKRAGNSHMPGGWTHGGNSPLTSTELADGHPLTVVYAGRNLLSRPAALGGGDHAE